MNIQDYDTLQPDDIWRNSHYIFENGDGTKYTVQVTPALYGGINVICNESSLWRWHGENDIKFLCGDNNKWTEKALIQIMNYHDARILELSE